MDIEVAKALYDVLPDSAKEKLINPTAAEAGQLFGEIAKTVNLGVGLPFRWMNSHLERLTELTKMKVQSIPEKRLDLSKLNLTSKIIMDSFHSVSEEEFLEAYSELITDSLDKETSEHVHPYYSSLLTQLTKADLELLEFIYLCEIFGEGDAMSITLSQEYMTDRKTIHREPALIDEYGRLTESYNKRNKLFSYRGERLHGFPKFMGDSEHLELIESISVSKDYQSSEFLLKNLGLIHTTNSVLEEQLSLEYTEKHTLAISEYFSKHFGYSFDDIVKKNSNKDILMLSETLGITEFAKPLVDLLFDPFYDEELIEDKQSDTK
ncbi:Abi-alpha family protein [Enterococcus raffinosus]|uniref:Abi-alpha family protein n=1 Tax=Enterococcus raffinosus TaxID=71452 RepID=UPI00288EC396|nr:Abi-alpha family protein [Enterococcus raffinosus]MDT2531899.1 Abi-alpha family protein [Enterococcus raffinosus]